MSGARLVSYSQPAPEFIDSFKTPMDLIAFCARVSNPANQYNPENLGLIKYLIRNKHWSPLEMASVCIEIETTRDIGRQLLRHGSFKFQEFSQRYADPTVDMHFEYREARLQDTKNRQNSFELDPTNVAHNRLEAVWLEKQRNVVDAAMDAYKFAIDNGIAKEQARVVLPEGLTMSRLYVNGTIRSWVHYIELRSKNGTQKEHVDIAMACAKAISLIFPMDEVCE